MVTWAAFDGRALLLLTLAGVLLWLWAVTVLRRHRDVLDGRCRVHSVWDDEDEVSRHWCHTHRVTWTGDDPTCPRHHHQRDS